MARWISLEPCIVTYKCPCDYHHLYSRGAHPDLKNKSWNMIPISRALHTEWHSKGAKYMTDKYPEILAWMIDNDWEFDENMNKWWHPH